MTLLSDPKEKILRHLGDVYVDEGPWSIDYDDIDNAHGYRIAQELGMHKSSVSRHLDDLEDAGLVKVVEREGEKGTTRRIYTLTDEGWEMLDIINPA